MEKKNISISKKARYFQLGKISEQTKTIWFVFHGYGMLSQYFIKKFKNLENNQTYILSISRDLKDEHQFPCALFYNGMGNWLYNKKSKTSGLEYAKRNLIQGGLYLDSIHMDTTILKDVEGLNYMATYDDKLIILRKE